MKPILLILLALLATLPALALDHPVPEIAKSTSPDTRLHAVMDIDRDPKLDPAWKENDYPRIEITEKSTAKVLLNIPYFGASADDERPLREYVKIFWRPDSQAFAINIDGRHYSNCQVYALDSKSQFVQVPFPTYQEMTGRPEPEAEELRPRGRSTILGWDEQGHLIHEIFLSPLPTAANPEAKPLEDRVLLKVTPTRMTIVRKP